MHCLAKSTVITHKWVTLACHLYICCVCEGKCYIRVDNTESDLRCEASNHDDRISLAGVDIAHKVIEYQATACPLLL